MTRSDLMPRTNIRIKTTLEAMMNRTASTVMPVILKVIRTGILREPISPAALQTQTMAEELETIMDSPFETTKTPARTATTTMEAAIILIARRSISMMPKMLDLAR